MSISNEPEYKTKRLESRTNSLTVLLSKEDKSLLYYFKSKPK